MAVITVVIVVGLVVGLLTAGLLRAWPRVDPGAPGAAAHAVEEVLQEHRAADSFLRRRTDPATATGLAVTVLFGLALAGIVIAGSLLVMIKTNSGFARWDQRAGEWGAEHATSASTRFLRDVSQLGGTAFTVTAAIVVGAVQTIRTRRRETFAFLATVFIGITLIVNVTKGIVDRDRPAIRQLTGFSSSSFPSGHAATSAAAFAALALVLSLGRSPGVKRALAGAAAGIAASVATTRVLLGVHWFTDVSAGLAIGWAWFAICSLAFGGRLLRFGAPVEAAARAVDLDDRSQPAGR
jgi:membrane-associated phospholipid phosphatase